MKAIVINQYGGPEVLKLENIEIKKPQKGQVLVRIMVSGINFIDIYQRRGTYPKKLPFTPGMEASGVIEEVGEGVTTFKPGDRVAYLHDPGSYAEAGLAHAEHLIPLPQDFSFEQGGAFPLQGMTAHYLLHAFRKPKPGEVVLIHAAAGGMGLLLVQWAHHMGAKVIGTVSTEEKAQAAREAGADEVILYTKQNFVTEVKRMTNDHGADLIIDGVGKTTFISNLEAAARRGNIVIYGAASGPAEPIAPNALMVKSLTISGGSLPNYMLTRDEMMMRANAVLEGIREGWLKLNITKVFPLKEASEAHRVLEDRQTIGKVLLSMNIK